MKSDAINSEKLIVINQSASKNKINFRNKKMIYKSDIPEYFINFLKKTNLEIPLRNF